MMVTAGSAVITLSPSLNPINPPDTPAKTHLQLPRGEDGCRQPRQLIVTQVQPAQGGRQVQPPWQPRQLVAS